ncbi:DUF2188 domain-containing protein [Primorskyibacter flagellatus]|uniref:DUF2188 domain-containing protein n=1 Tax=Primorskyibacter flagellatus TaxID=1387277 RepID=UPI003A90C744
MPDKRDYWTQRRPDGKWESKREGASRASAVTETQAEAWEKSKDFARDRSGEAYLKGRDGLIRERNTYGHDPENSKG